MTQNPPEKIDLATSRKKYKKVQEEKDKDEDEEPLHLPVFRVPIKYYVLPILIAIISTCLLCYVMFYGANFQEQAAQISSAFFPDIGNSFFFVVGLILTTTVAAVLMVKLLQKYGIKALRVIYFALFLLIGATLIIIFGSGLLDLFSAPDEFYLAIRIGGIIGGLLLAYIFYSEKFTAWAKGTTILIYSILFGAILSMLFPPLIAMMFLIGLSIFDLISVFRGPTKKMLQLIEKELRETQEKSEKGTDSKIQESKTGPEKTEPEKTEPEKTADLSVHAPKIERESVPTSIVKPPEVGTEKTLGPEIQSTKVKGEPKKDDTDEDAQEEDTIEIGIGDLTMFSFFAANALIYTNSILITIFTICGILIGVWWTLRLIYRNKILPGLPLSIFIGIALYWLGVFIDAHVQFFLFFH